MSEQMNGRQIQRRLKLRGLEVRPDALTAIQSVLRGETNPSASLDRIVTCLREKIASVPGSSCIVDRRLVSEAVLELSKNDDDIISESITVWDAFRIPYVHYNSTSRTFQVIANDITGKESLHGEPNSKTRLLRERFTFVHQRVMRHHLFAPRLVGANDTGEAAVTLTPIEALAAGGGDPNHLHHVMGVLTRVDDENLWLEDLNGKLPLDIRHDEVVCGQGLFTVGCVVIAAGYLRSSQQIDEENAENASAFHGNKRSLGSKSVTFRVTALMMPPKESRKDSERAHPGSARRLLGLPDLSAKDLKSMKEMEEESEETFFLMMSDIHLDDPDTIRTLRKVFEGFAEYPPQLIILIGNFSRRPFGYGNRSTNNDQISAAEFGDLFENLGNLMLQYPTLLGQGTRWVFVPGPRDPSASPREILPRPCIPKGFCERLTNKLPETCRVSFTSNPTRIMFYNQEICFFRNDTMSKMRRNCVIPPTEGNPQKASEDLVSTLCNQGHLCPVTLDSRPIYCGYERSLRLFPLPDVVVLADHYEQYQWKFDDCQMLNPGSFSSDGSFVVYRPSTEQTEFSRVSRTGKDEE